VKVVATTTIVADLVRQVGGERVEVQTLMAPGVDPHSYRATPADLASFEEADIIFYSGLGLEARLERGLEGLETRAVPHAVARGIEAVDGDPHVWHDVTLWRRAARQVRDDLSERDRANATVYRENAARYDAQLVELDRWVRRRVARVPARERVVVASHPGFGYFGRAYGFRVRSGRSDLLTDWLGKPGSFAETYLGMVRSNVDAILSRSAGR
jgi:manganese/zinc/iron transport system substrate-binding protein